jgi:hypothetical protein
VPQSYHARAQRSRSIFSYLSSRKLINTSRLSVAARGASEVELRAPKRVTLPLPDISEQIVIDLESPHAKRDSKHMSHSIARFSPAQRRSKSSVACF